MWDSGLSEGDQENHLYICARERFRYEICFLESSLKADTIVYPRSIVYLHARDVRILRAFEVTLLKGAEINRKIFLYSE